MNNSKFIKSICDKLINILNELWNELPKENKIEISKKLFNILIKSVSIGVDFLANITPIIINKFNQLHSNNNKNKNGQAIMGILDDVEKTVDENISNVNIDKVELIEKANEEIIIYDPEKSMNDNNSIKIVFLSGDGVIFENKNKWFCRNLDNIIFNQKAINNLKEIVDKSNAYIIITTSVRNYPGGKALLDLEMENVGLKKHLIGYTPMKVGVSREKKIAEKIDNNKQIIDQLVILDRRENMGNKLNEWLIPCKNGIDDSVKEKVLKMLDTK